VGTDSFHTPPELVALAEKAFAGVGAVGIDSPFSGAYVPLRYYEREPQVTALMVEIRRDTYMNEPGGPAGPGFSRLVSALTALVDAVDS
jgi:N-formylglutamate amidohydrolase